MNRTWTAAVAAFGLAGVAAAVDPLAPAAPPPLDPLPPPAEVAPTAPLPQPQPLPPARVVVNGPEVIVHQRGNGSGSSTVISGSGNGFGNRIMVGSGPAGGTTVIQNSRNGFGNQIIVDGEELGDFPPLVAAPPTYRGRDAKFWTKKVFSEDWDCNVYWCPKAGKWYRYAADEDVYRPLPVGAGK